MQYPFTDIKRMKNTVEGRYYAVNVGFFRCFYTILYKMKIKISEKGLTIARIWAIMCIARKRVIFNAHIIRKVQGGIHYEKNNSHHLCHVRFTGGGGNNICRNSR